MPAAVPAAAVPAFPAAASLADPTNTLLYTTRQITETRGIGDNFAEEQHLVLVKPGVRVVAEFLCPAVVVTPVHVVPFAVPHVAVVPRVAVVPHVVAVLGVAALGVAVLGVAALGVAALGVVALGVVALGVVALGVVAAVVLQNIFSF